ncbi:MAG TPA: ribonuclease Y [Thermoanaerobaculia bacterium]|nr:ribonuclease Y [Thermoanaerobaculia bacterium]
MVFTAIAFIGVLAVVLVWWFGLRRAARQILVQARHDAAKMAEDARRDAAKALEDAERQGETRLREAEIVAKEKLLQARSEFEAVSRKRRTELEALERRLTQKEDNLDKRTEELTRREKELNQQDRSLAGREKVLEKKEGDLDRMLDEERVRLEQIAGLTAQQAREELVRVMEDDARIEAAHIVKRIEDEAREQAHKQAQRIIGMAIQRSASDYVSEATVSVVMLPNDEMKGRIIGREGRNIRALETATGVDLIVDDTPEAVILSGFDPFRREIARVALERLITDGRIHPARIEEVVEKVKAEFEQRIHHEGEAALLELAIPGMHPELVKLIGRLRYRTSYGQNVLQHSKEVAFLAGAMAAELKANVQVARRAGLTHDIGKAIDREMDGTHLQIGIDLLRKYGETEEVVHAMACHHGDYDPQTVEAVLVTAADALSAARPGARREILETYVKRLEKLEEIASNFKGVQKVFAIQAGREIRIVVDSGKIGDEQALWLSKDIARKIEAELTYPGQIKVTVIRETRSVEYAR